MVAFMWFGWLIFSIDANVFVRCWYSSCSFIVHSIKYVLYLYLCGDGCVSSMFGMDLGLVSMSPHLSSCSDLLME